MSNEASATILIIDDEPLIRGLLRTALGRAKFNVLEAENGAIGLEVFDLEKPDLVMVDLSMPVIGGLDVVAQIHRMSPDTPLIVISGASLIDDAIGALQEGAWDFITKPFRDLSIMHHAVDKALERSRLLKDNRAYQTNLEKQVKARTADLQATNIELTREIRERKQAEKKISESEQKYRELVETSQDLIWKCDAEGKFTYLNQAWEQTIGYKSEEMIGRPFSHFQRPEIFERDLKEFSRHLAGGFVKGYETSYISKSGADIQLVFNAIPLLDGDNNIVGTQGTAYDITDRKRIETALLESEEVFRQYAENNSAAVWVYSLDQGRPLFINQAWEAITGHTCQEWYDRPGIWLELVHPDDAGEFSGAQDRAKLSGYEEVFDVEYRITNKNRQTLWVRDRTFPIRDSYGQVYRLAGLLENITERKVADEALRESQERYRRLAEASHEGIGVTELGIIRDINHQLAEMLGYQRQELLGEPVAKLIAPESRGLVRSKGDDEDEDAYEHMALKKNGVRIPVEVRARTLRLEGRKLKVTAVRDLTDRKKAEDALQDRLRFESLLAEMSATFINLPSSRVDQEIKNWLERIATLVGADRCIVWARTRGTDLYVPSHSWAADGARSFTPTSSDEYPWMAVRLQAGESIDYRADNLPPDASKDAHSLHEQGIMSGVVAPMDAGGSLGGALSLSSDDSEIGLAHGLDRRLRLVAEVIGNAILRKEAEEELQRAMDEISHLKEQAEAENLYLREEIQASGLFGDMIGQSNVMKTVMAQAEQVAKTDSTVLILGETGTGKELMARAIHDMSNRSSKPLITVNCAAMPAALVESELFGREKGAFTGALTKQIGRFEAADGGTILLDEVGELPVDTQAKLLRVLQSGQLERLGSHQPVTVDVRIITATNRDLEKEVRRGNFREDLFYRLNVFPITVPPLRDRTEDIPELVWAFVDEFSRKMGKRIESIPEKNMGLLVKHRWPGNIRELRNVVERAMIRASSKKLLITPPKEAELRPSSSRTLDEVERQHVLDTLRFTHWQVRGRGKAAEILGLNPSTLESRMKKLRIIRPDRT